MICMQRTLKSFNCAQIRSTMQFSAICLQFLSAHDKLHSIVANYLMCLYIYAIHIYTYMCLLTDLSMTKDMNCILYWGSAAQDASRLASSLWRKNQMKMELMLRFLPFLFVSLPLLSLLSALPLSHSLCERVVPAAMFG